MVSLLWIFLLCDMDSVLYATNNCRSFIWTINVPVVFMAWYIMVLRRATSLRVALEGVGPENWDFFDPLKWPEQSECHLGPKKSRFLGPTPSNAPSNDVAALKIIKYKRHKNNRYIGSFMYPSAVVYCCCVLEGWGGLLGLGHFFRYLPSLLPIGWRIVEIYANAEGND